MQTIERLSQSNPRDRLKLKELSESCDSGRKLSWQDQFGCEAKDDLEFFFSRKESKKEVCKLYHKGMIKSLVRKK